MTNEQQALAEMPIWLVIVLALIGGVSGEMWRATKREPVVGRWYGAWRCVLGRAWSAACRH